MRIWRTFLLVAVALMAAPGTASTQEVAPACRVLGSEGVPSTQFVAGDEVTIEGEGFTPRSTVVVTFQQETRTIVLARPVADTGGRFATAVVSLPQDAASGPAAVRALQGSASGTCQLTLQASGGFDLTSLFPFAAGLGGLAVLLVMVLVIRRARPSGRDRELENLAFLEEVDGLKFVSPRSGPSVLEAVEDDPMFAVNDPEDARRSEGPESPDEDGAPSEPPLLPPDWAAGRLRPSSRKKHHASKTIQRLQQEVKAWKSSGP